MLFTTDEIKDFDVSDEEWLYPDKDSVLANVCIQTSDWFLERAAAFVGYTLKDVIEYGWIDICADIDVMERKVKTLYVYVRPERTDISEKTFCLSFYFAEGRELCHQLEQTNGVSEFIDDCKRYVENGWEDIK